MPTEILKLVIWFSLVLQVTKSSTSGWSTRRTAILAPRRVPPWAISPKAWSYTRRNPTGPVAWPAELFTSDPLGRRREKENPLPPPVCWIRAASRRVWKIPAESLPMSSVMGSTKQAASCPSGVPAPVKVGEFGKEFLAGQQFEIFDGSRISISSFHSASTLATW